MRPCSRRWWTSRCRRSARRSSRRRNCGAGNWRRWSTWFLAGARSQPVALAFEDLHWADPTSLDLMQALAERGAQAPLLILATARPEFRPPWSLRSHHSVISLSPLDRADVAQMVGELAARHALSQRGGRGVSERTGGVPLFVEEVTRLLLERGEAGGLQAIPPTLQQSLAARLDRLGEARESRADRRGARARFHLCAAARRRRNSTTPPCSPRSTGSPSADLLSSRARARGDLSLQARADPGRGLRQPAQEPPPGAAPPRRRSPARSARARRGRAGSHRPSFHRGRPRRPRDRMVGQGGRPGSAPLGLPGGDRPSRQGDRHGGQGGGAGRPGERAAGRRASA